MKNLKLKMKKRKVNMKVRKIAVPVGLRNQRILKYKIYLKEPDQIRVLPKKNQLNQIVMLVNL